MKIGRIWFGRSWRIKNHPLIHMIEVDARDNPVGKTYCGKAADDWHKYHVIGETSTLKPTCKKCNQKQQKESTPIIWPTYD